MVSKVSRKKGKACLTEVHATMKEEKYNWKRQLD